LLLRPAVSTAAAIVVCLIIGAPLAAAATLTLPPDAGASPGFTAVVGLTIDDASGMLGTDLVVTYDPAVVAAIDVTTTGLSAPHLLTDNLAPAGMIRISLYGATPLSGSGSLLAITFEAVGPPGSRTSLDLLSADLNEGGIPAALVDGQFCVDGTGEEVEGLDAAMIPASTTAMFSWIDGPYTDTYNLYRATRADLADLGCLFSAIPGPSTADDGAVPPSGGLFIYLVTGDTCSGETSAGQDSTGAERSIPAPCS
jgi:hypothetical protein